MLLDLRLGDADGFDLLVELRSGLAGAAGGRGLGLRPQRRRDPRDRPRRDGLRAQARQQRDAEEALHVVMSGGIYVPPMTMGGDGEAPPTGDAVPRGRSAEPAPAARHPAAADRARAFKLTPRQTDVLALLLRASRTS